jgi:hypothetical protein
MRCFSHYTYTFSSPKVSGKVQNIERLHCPSSLTFACYTTLCWEQVSVGPAKVELTVIEQARNSHPARRDACGGHTATTSMSKLKAASNERRQKKVKRTPWDFYGGKRCPHGVGFFHSEETCGTCIVEFVRFGGPRPNEDI